jgi:hypothetical protein
MNRGGFTHHTRNVMFRLGLMYKEFTLADVQEIVASGAVFESLTEFKKSNY